MPYFNFTQEMGKPDVVTEEILGNESEASFFLSTSAAEGLRSSRVADITGESSSSETFKSNYAKLPDYLKSCLDYSAIVCGRSGVEIGKLVRLLLAEGLIEDRPGDIMEDVAENVLKELIDLGMLQKEPIWAEVKVPASYLRLCILKLEKQDFVSKSANSPVRLRIRDDGRDIYPNVEGLLIQSLFIDSTHRGYSFGSSRGLSRAYMRNVCGMHFLLVLDLDGKIECLPDELGDLIHLRYLGLVNSYLDELPGTLGNLKRLQTLDIRRCRKLRKLPIQILHIQQLRHLLMSDSSNDCGIRVPKGIGTLVNLHTLSGIYGGDDIAMELIAITQLRELGVKRVADDHASELFAAIKKMENLTSLSLEAEENYFEDTPSSIFPELDAFSPPPLLQKFFLRGGLIEMPVWFASMENLTRLSLFNSYLSENPTSVLQLLPKLKHLNLWKAYKARHIGKEFCNAGGFPMLETLTIASEFLAEWTEIETGAFPRLSYLCFRSCRNLIFLPDGLQNIATLQDLHFLPCHPDLRRRLMGEENYKIEHVPNIWMVDL
ncbi:PREDICTED: disease resistance protein RPM1-like [Populus euphratica]|uniref:Disease resistance protein RPM1-like n=1 Tax=Populus euphratica TaxID=75702 RepID=A0AAJ6VCR2_POPEU|nr:PREDICTED: disease resistance protein RPM1-like [Populus euphratica]